MCSHANEASRVSPVVSPLSYDFRIKARDQFVSSMQADVSLLPFLFVIFYWFLFSACC